MLASLALVSQMSGATQMGPWIPLVNNPRTTIVVDTSGLHSLMIRFCRCADTLSPDMQIFEMGLFPASFTSPKTTFTFVVLDDFLLDNLEFTSSVFPHLVPWNQVKQLKWHGFSHEKRKPKAGELTLFCPTCPQPRVNVNFSDRNGSNPAWLYLRSLVQDTANVLCHKLEVTGIGGCACARHGCFIPHSMVDFQKGKRFAV
ncbi:uncharacterized protein EDB91DRAFT_1240306 [Suillus paluster]|uniref:uncharacterized protein n=1 Tax=Suillus paluster TaxID=48578 RepID=UPI001B885F40|nr:uncharacterized protein EDB91DRAFT_1240306 [Suillus paluster]KAG1721470.1 hypothetical protein EDB91DRAFT_1240306 [Suillus paluster]